MDLEKIYYDSDGNECNILQLIKKEPEWAANRIQEGEKAIKKINNSIEYTKNKTGMKMCVSGLIKNSSNMLDCTNKMHSKGFAFALREFSKHYYQAREAWLSGDLHTVAEFFGLYT